MTLSGDGAENINGEYDGVKFTGGIGVFTLKHGESKTFENLPVGLSYKVVESDNEGYTVASQTGDIGTISENPSRADFTNKKKDTNSTPPPTAYPTPPPTTPTPTTPTPTTPTPTTPTPTTPPPTTPTPTTPTPTTPTLTPTTPTPTTPTPTTPTPTTPIPTPTPGSTPRPSPTPQVTIPSGDTPLADIPRDELVDILQQLPLTSDLTEEEIQDLLEIVDDRVPLSDLTFEELLEILEELVPRASVPKTGDDSQTWMAAALLSGAGLVWLALKKKEEDAAE